MIRLINFSLNQGVDQAGNSIGQPTGFVAGCALNLNPADWERESRALQRKLDDGARFALTQPVFNVAAVQRFLDHFAGQAPYPIILGLLPLYSARHAALLQHEVPGIAIPEQVLARIEAAEGRGEARDEGIRIAREILMAVRSLLQGVYIMPPLRRYDVAAEAMAALREPQTT